MFSLFKKPEEEIAVVFDIGNGSVGAALVQFSAHGIPTILYTHREPLTFQSRITSKRLLETMLKLLKVVAEHLQKEGLSHIHRTMFGTPVIKQVTCVLSSPWYISQTKVIKVESERSFKVTEGYIDSMIDKEQKEFNEALADGRYEKLFGNQVRLLERKIVHTRLNGYEVVDPLEKQARELEVTFFMSFISEDIVRKVEAVLHKAFHFRKIRFYSYALSSWSAVRDMFPDNDNFIFADITGEVTDISLTSKGVLMETVSFPSGRSMLIRHVVDALTVPPEVALSFLKMHSSNSANEAFTKKLDKIGDEAAAKWHEALIDSLRDLQKRYPLPRTLFVTVDSDLSSYFLNALQKPTPTELGVPQNAFNVVFLNVEKVKHFVDCAPRVAQDPFLGLESVFLNKIMLS